MNIVGFKETTIDLRVPLTGDIRTTLTPLTYYSELVGAEIIVPVNTDTDLGSIPQFLQGIFPKDGKAMFAYILHDNLYDSGLYSQSISDSILEEAMKTLKVGWFTRKAVHNGLRVGGFVTYNKYRKDEECTK